MNKQELIRQAVEMGLSWGRVFIAAVLAQILAGVTDWQLLLNAGAVAVIPVVLRYLDSSDPVYGKGVPNE